MKLASAVLVAATAILGGCAAPQQPPLSLNPEAVGTQSGRIGVVMTAVPKPDTQFPGAGCLLCVAAANAAHTTLTGYTQTLPAEEVSNLKNEVAALIRKKGGNVTVIAEDLKVDDLPDATTKGVNTAAKDYTTLKKRYDVDKLVVLSVTTMGIERPFSAYIPTGDPKGVLAGQGYLVNLNNNTYEWYQNVRSTRAADGKWDEPPKFPGLTNAYFQAIEMGMDEFKKPFSR